LASQHLKFIHLKEYQKILDLFREKIEADNKTVKEENKIHSDRMLLLMEKLDDFFTLMIDQKIINFCSYWLDGKFFFDFLFKQRDIGVINLCLKIIFKIIKNRNKSQESIRNFFGEDLKKFVAFISAINSGSLLCTQHFLNTNFFHDASLNQGELYCFANCMQMKMRSMKRRSMKASIL
jgi:hypothetical protein